MTNNTGNNSTVFQISLVEMISWPMVFVLVDIVILICNVLVFYYYLTVKHTRERPKAHYFLINLAIMDTLVGLVSLPLYTYFLIQWFLKGEIPNHELFYQLFTVSDLVTGYGSMLTTVLISIDRFGAVVFPFRHRSIKRTMYIYSIFAAWMTAGSIALISLSTFITNSHYYIFDYVSGTVFILAIVMVIITNLVIVFRAKCLHNHDQVELRRHEVYHKKLSRTFQLVVVAFFCTWLPFQCINYTHVILDNFTVIPSFLNYLTKLLQFGGSIINCVIYYNNNEEFKSTIKRLLTVHRRSRKYRVSSEKHVNHVISLEITNNQSP